MNSDSVIAASAESVESVESVASKPKILPALSADMIESLIKARADQLAKANAEREAKQAKKAPKKPEAVVESPVVPSVEPPRGVFREVYHSDKRPYSDQPVRS